MERNILTPLQIKKIHFYLQSQYIHYIDVQLELVDHIASRIESRIVEEVLTFDEAYRFELKQWTWLELDNIVDSKRKNLNSFWKKRMYSYLLSFLSFPKVATIVLSFAILVVFVLAFVPTELFVSSALVFLGLVFIISFGISRYYTYANQNYQEEFLAEESYRKGMAGIYSLLFCSYFILDWFPISEYAESTKACVLCALIIFSITLLFATWFVFPKWLSSDVIEKYEHLLISN